MLMVPFLQDNHKADSQPENIVLTNGWRIYADGVAEDGQNQLPYRLTETDVSTIDLYCTLPVTPFQVPMLSFVLFQKDVSVYVDNTLIFEKTFIPGPLNPRFPGGGTCMMPLPTNSAGKELHIKMNKVVMEDNSALTMVKLFEGIPTPQTRAPKDIFIFVLMVSMFSIGALLLLVSVFYRKMEIYLIPLVYLSVGLVSIACWTLCNSKMMEVFVDNWAFVHTLEYISFYFMPICVLSFIEENWSGTSKTLRWMNRGMLCFFAFTLGARGFLNIDFFRWITVFHGLVLLVLLVIMKELITKQKGSSQSFRIMCVGAFVLAGATLMEMGRYYVYFSGVKESVAQIFIIGLAFFSVALIISFVTSTKENMDASFTYMTQSNLNAEHHRYKMLMSNTKDIYMDWNLMDDTVYFSEQYEPYFGKPPYVRNIMQSTAAFGDTIQFTRNLEEVYHLILAGSVDEKLEGSFQTSSGETRVFELALSSVLDRERKPLHVIGIIHDITNERELAQEMARQREYMQMNEQMFDNILEADISENQLLGKNCNVFAKKLLGKESATYSEVIAAISQKLTHEDFADAYFEMLSRERILSLFENNIYSFVYECRELSETGVYHWIRLNVRIFKSEITQTIRIISYAMDIEDEKQREIKLRNDSLLDSLTGILNKGGTKQRINEFLTANQGQVAGAFLMLDVDYFKTINDTLGHAAGDTVITEIAQKLKHSFHREDFVGRVGGDEFVVFMKDMPEPSRLEQRLETLCTSFCDARVYNGKEYRISISVGVSLYPIHGLTYDELYGNADMALYASKNKGRNTYSFFGMD